MMHGQKNIKLFYERLIFGRLKFI